MSRRIIIVGRYKQEKLKSVINLYNTCNVQTFAFGLKRYLRKDKGMDKEILLLSLFASQQFRSTWTAFLWAVSSLCYHACHNRLSSYFPNTFRSELIKLNFIWENEGRIWLRFNTWNINLFLEKYRILC